MRKRGSIIAVLVALLVSMLWTSPTASASGSCYASGVHAGYSTYTCHIWRANHPWGMWGSANFQPQGNTDGVLGAGNSWFVCQKQFVITLEYGSLVNNWFGYTLSDNGFWGWVNATHFSAGGNMGPVPGLGYCPGGFGETGSYPGDRPTIGSRLLLPGPDGESGIWLHGSKVW